jgi:hypothetical protein
MKFDSDVIIGTRAYLKQNANATTTNNNNNDNGCKKSRQQSFHQEKNHPLRRQGSFCINDGG